MNKVPLGSWIKLNINGSTHSLLVTCHSSDEKILTTTLIMEDLSLLTWSNDDNTQLYPNGVLRHKRFSKPLQSRITIVRKDELTEKEEEVVSKAIKIQNLHAPHQKGRLSPSMIQMLV